MAGSRFWVDVGDSNDDDGAADDVETDGAGHEAEEDDDHGDGGGGGGGFGLGIDDDDDDVLIMQQPQLHMSSALEQIHPWP